VWRVYCQMRLNLPKRTRRRLMRLAVLYEQYFRGGAGVEGCGRMSPRNPPSYHGVTTLFGF
jgi:hypothetical protein